MCEVLKGEMKLNRSKTNSQVQGKDYGDFRFKLLIILFRFFFA